MMMRVRMKGDISGSRNGVDWPRRGGYIDLPDDEARALIANKMAEAVESPTPVEEPPAPPVEAAAVEDDAEKAVKKTQPRKRTGMTKSSSGLHPEV